MHDRPFLLLASFPRSPRSALSDIARAGAFVVALGAASTLTACSEGSDEPSEHDHDHPDASDHAPGDEPPQGSKDDPADVEACDHEIHEMTLDEALHATDATEAAVWIVRARHDETFLTWSLRETEDGAAPMEGTFGEEQRTPPEAPSAPLVQTECHDHGDHFHCGPSFIATRGTWRIDAIERRIGGTFRATIDARFEQARISKGKATLTSDGASVCLHGITLSGTLTAP